MVNLNCPCFNVEVEVRSRALPPISEATLKEFGANDLFVKQDIKQLQLDIGGIKFQQPYLITERVQNRWIIYKCINCDLETHSLPRMKDGSFPQDFVIVSSNLISNDDKKRIEKLPNYSSVFKILLNNKGFLKPVGRPDAAIDGLENVKHQLGKFLTKAEEKTENDIRSLVEVEHFKFIQLQNKALDDADVVKNLLLSVHISDDDNNDVLQAAAPPRPSAAAPSRPPGDEKLSGEVLDETTKATDQVPPMRNIRYAGMGTSRRINIRRSSTPARLFPRSLDSEALFVMDDIAGGHSSQDVVDDRDSESSSDDDETVVPGNYRSSSPVEVPKGSFQDLHVHESSEEETEPINHLDIAASINELARSVRRDGREVFGDLPRPRFNTYT